MAHSPVRVTTTILLLGIVAAIVAWLCLRVPDLPGEEVVAEAVDRGTSDPATPVLDPEPAEPERLAEPAVEITGTPEAVVAAERTRVFGPTVVLRIRERGTRVELGGVELRWIADVFMSSSWRRPEADTLLLLEDVSSPITLRTWRWDDTEESLANGLGLQGAGEPEERLLDFDGDAGLSRGFTMYARSDGFAWGSTRVDVRTGGEREILLDRSGSLSVRLGNVRLDAYEKLGRRPYLHLRRPEFGWGENLSETIGLRSDHVANGISFESLEPGRYEISVELGIWYDEIKPQVLGKRELTITAAEQGDVLLRLEDPPEPRPQARLSGTLSFPPFPASDSVDLRVHDLLGTHREVKSIQLSEMRPISGSGHAWDAGELPVGRYQIKVWPFLVSWIIDLPAEGNHNVILHLAELAEVEIETIDAETRQRVPLEELVWSYERALTDMVNHVGATLKSVGDPGRFRVYTAPGPIRASVYEMPEELNYGFGSVSAEVMAGHQRILLELSPGCALRIEIHEGGASLPHGAFGAMDITATEVGGAGQVIIDATRTDGILHLSGPGEYELTFGGIPGDFKPVPPRRVEVRPGETVDIVVELERR